MSNKLTRHRVREKLSSCLTHADYIIDYLEAAAQPFIQQDHPYTEGFYQLNQVAQQLRDLIREFRDSM